MRGEIERPLIDGEQGAAVLAIALAALRSSAERPRRAIDDVRAAWNAASNLVAVDDG